MHTMCFVNNIRHIYPYAYYIIDINPPAPKVPRRDSLGAEPIDSSNPLFTGGAGGGGLIFRFDPPPKRCFWLWQFAIFAYRYNIAQIPDSDPISGRNKGSTSQLGSNMAQRGHLSST